MAVQDNEHINDKPEKLEYLEHDQKYLRAVTDQFP